MTDKKEQQQELIIKTETKEQESKTVNINDTLIHSITSKEIPDTAALWFLTEPPNPCLFFEELRWKINLCGLHHPFRCIPLIAFVTVSDIFMLVLFLLWIIAPLLYNIHNLNDGLHGVALAFGGGAARNFFLTLILIQRNTILRYIFGLPFERAIAYHVTVSRIALIHLWLHFILQLIYYRRSVAHLLGRMPGIIGFIAFICGDIAAIIAHDTNRRKCFELFINTHRILMPLFTILMIIHVPFYPFGILLLIALASLAIDILIKMCITKVVQPVTLKHIEYLDDLNVVKIIWNKKDFKFCGGQYVFLCVPSISSVEFHPFSISCPSTSSDGDCTVHIKCIGDFVEKLKALSTDANIDIDQMQILIDGPYGRPCIPFMRYSSMILMCGGIGITPMISIFDELVHNGAIASRIHFVWSIKSPQMIKEFDVIIKSIILKDTQHNINTKLREEIVLNETLQIKVSYYVTDKSIADNQSEQDKWSAIYPNLYFKRCQPKVIIDDALKSKGNKCIGIMGCGPKGMTRSIRSEAAVNNIHCHTEIFYF